MKLLLFLLACAPKPVAVMAPPVVAPPPYEPADPVPLPARSFAIPEVKHATLSNGAAVALVEDHEVPLVSVSFSFKAGALSDPSGKEGLAVQEIIEAAIRSYEGGTVESVPV